MKRYELDKANMKNLAGIRIVAGEGVKLSDMSETNKIVEIHAVKGEARTEGYSSKYSKPIIPAGYKYLDGKWNSGYTIERESDGSRFVWVPVGALSANATLDGIVFDEKFGRVNSMGVIFSPSKYNENINPELLAQISSVKKHGGFYISAYSMSLGDDGNIHSIAGVKPMVDVSFHRAEDLAEKFERSKDVKSHLTYGAEYDTVCKWIEESGAKKRTDFTSNSMGWGNYKSMISDEPSKMELTGSREKWKANGIYDLAGNVMEWTQESFGKFGARHITRGGAYCHSGLGFSAASRHVEDARSIYPYVGFRVVLCIK